MKTVELQTVSVIKGGGKLGLSGKDFVEEGFPAYGAGGVNGAVAIAEYDRPAVVLSSIGARCGKCFLAEGKWTSLANTQLILPDLEIVDPRFLWYQLNDESRWHRSGTGQPFIKPADVKKHRIWVPPLTEQRRISAILDHGRAIRSARRETVDKLDDLAKAIFAKMFSTANATTSGWVTTTLGTVIADGPQNGLYKPASKYGSGTPIVRIDSFQGGTPIDLDKLRRVEISESEARLYGLDQGDILVNRVNARTHLGKATMVSRLRETTVFESNMMRLKVDTEVVLPEYVLAFLGTAKAKTQIQAAAKDAVNQSSINQKDVSQLELLVPPIATQERFVLLAKAIRDQQTRCKKLLAAVDGLTAPLQRAAFAGQL